MAKARLTDDELDRIVGLLLAWRDDLTWDLLIQQVQHLLRRPFTRQGLSKQQRVLAAFQQAKGRLRTSPRPASYSDMSVELATTLKRISFLEAEIELLKTERHLFHEKFATWLYNARSRGISESELNTPLPEIDRHGSTRR